jgi:hypothetical protein
MPAAEKRKTVCIPVGPLFYEVGPDIHLAADTFRAKQLHDEYTESPEYMALLRGALSMMKVPHRFAACAILNGLDAHQIGETDALVLAGPVDGKSPGLDQLVHL